MPFTNRGKKLINDSFFRGTSPVTTQFYVALTTNAPTPDTDTLGELTQVPVGNGYVNGGQLLERNSTGFPTSTEDDINDRAIIGSRNIVWTASGGPLPSTGGASYLVLTDDNATVANRQVLAWAEIPAAPVSVPNGQTLTLTFNSVKLPTIPLYA